MIDAVMDNERFEEAKSEFQVQWDKFSFVAVSMAMRYSRQLRIVSIGAICISILLFLSRLGHSEYVHNRVTLLFVFHTN